MNELHKIVVRHCDIFAVVSVAGEMMSRLVIIEVDIVRHAAWFGATPLMAFGSLRRHRKTRKIMHRFIVVLKRL